MKALKKIVSLCTLFVSLSACSQKTVIQAWSPEQIGPGNLVNMVYLFNKADVSVQYSLSSDQVNWQTEKLKSLQDVVYRVNIYVSLGTDGKQIVYSLEKGNSYFICFDDETENYVIRRRKS